MTPTPTTDSAVSPVSDERLKQLQFEVSAIEPSRRISMSSEDRRDLLSIFAELALSRRSLDTADGVEVKARFLSDLAGVDDAEYFAKKAAGSSWQVLAETAMSALQATRASLPAAMDEPLAFGVLDMDGECLHSVHIFQAAAEKAAFGLGRAVPLGISPQAHPNMGMEHIGWAVQDSDGSWDIKPGKAMPTGIRLTLPKPVYVRKETGE